MSDESYKIIVIGNCGVGKTSLVRRFVEDVFTVNKNSTTIGSGYNTRKIELGDKVIHLNLWDIVGQQRFRAVFYTGSHGAIIVYDITDQDSFSNITYWIDEVNRYAPGCSMLLVGNKCDLSNRQIDNSVVGEVAKDLNIPFLETSAKSSINVEQAFISLAAEIKNKPQFINIVSQLEIKKFAFDEFMGITACKGLLKILTPNFLERVICNTQLLEVLYPQEKEVLQKIVDYLIYGGEKNKISETKEIVIGLFFLENFSGEAVGLKKELLDSIISRITLKNVLDIIDYTNIYLEKATAFL